MNVICKIIDRKNEWDEVLSQFKEKDIFFKYEYLDLYSKSGEYPLMFYMESSIGKMAYPFMLRDISYSDNFKDKIEKDLYFDISTAYGYGGHLIQANEDNLRISLIELFYEKFGDFCKEKNVVSEFIKFSPLLKNHKDIDRVVNSFYLKKVVATDLQSYGDPLYGEVKKRKRADSRKRRKLGMKTVFEFSPKSFDVQFKIYNETMDRNNASDFYYFSKDYFDKMLATLSDNILIVNVIFKGKIIGFELCFLYGDFIHSHLGGTLLDYIKKSPNDLSSVDIINWGHKNNYKYFYVGGGITSDEDDSLYLYKKAFAKNTDFNYYLGNKVWNQDDYDYLTSLVSRESKDKNKGFFPLYRI